MNTQGVSVDTTGFFFGGVNTLSISGNTSSDSKNHVKQCSVYCSKKYIDFSSSCIVSFYILKSIMIKIKSLFYLFQLILSNILFGAVQSPSRHTYGCNSVRKSTFGGYGRNLPIDYLLVGADSDHVQ